VAALPSTARDEDLEDLFCFVIESIQFSGLHVAYDDADVDQVCLRSFFS
jgi:hypothetical protein